MNRMLLGASASLWAFACASPPREPAQLPPAVVSASATSEPAVASEAPPTSYAEVDKLLVRARAESESDRKKTYGLARAALVALTREAGRPAIVTSVKTAGGREETRLVPQGRRVETATWGALQVAGERVLEVGERVVSLDGGRITIWGAEPVRIDGHGATTLSAPQGEKRFVLAVGNASAFVIDSETGKTLLESPTEGAMLVRTKSGETRFLHLRASGQKPYELSELPSGKVVVSWPRLVAHDSARGLAAVIRDQGKRWEVAIVSAAEGPLAQQTIGDPEAFGAPAMARISPDLKSIAFVDKTEAKRYHLETNKVDVLKRQSAGAPAFRSIALTADSQHACVDAPGDAFPRPKGVPGTSQRCYVAGGTAFVANLAAPPIGFRRASGGPSQTYEIVSPEGALVAAVLHDGTPTSAKRFTVAVYDAATGKQLWNQFLDSMKSLSSPPTLAFSEDGSQLVIDGVRLDGRTGVAVDEKPVDSASLTPLMKRFGMNVAGKSLSYMRLGYDVPFFEKGQLVWTVDLAPRPLSIILDPVTLTLALRGHGSKQSIVLASGPTSALAFLPDGSFARSGDGSDLVCELGAVLAPIEVCRTSQEIPALRVPEALGELSR